MKTEWLIILDYSTGKTLLHQLEAKDDTDYEEVIESLGIRFKDCEWMIVSNLVINTIQYV